MDGGAAIEILIQNLINVLREEYSLLRGLDEDAQKLQRTLIMIMAYLSDAQKKFIIQDSVKIWLRELEALTFDADNVLDELSYHLLRKKVKKMMTPTTKYKVPSCFSSFSRVSRRHNMAYTIKQINAEFESMNKRATDLGLQSMIVNAPDVVAVVSFETDSLSLDPIFIGRDDDVPKLVHMLTPIHQDQIFSIVSLVGMGGMGKTTLTRKVFNHERVKARFGSLIWVHVSQTFDPINLFNKIYSTLTSNTGHRVEIKEVILKRLQEVLKSKTYLLVLDDVWNEDVPKWEDFINSISGVTATKGNGIIITTRSQKVASIVNSLEYALSGLSDDDCWSIIKAKAFDGNGEVPSRVVTIGRKIAERCRGLPLAANIVGGVLRYKSEEEWRFIAENWLSDGEGGENISKILKFSYDHLSSPSLKKCFAYCSVFPKGYIGMKQELIELWMAEGFLQQSEINDMESVGNMFYNVLLQMSLLQVATKDDYGYVERFVMHDLVHDLASSVLSSNANSSTIVRYMFLEKESIPIPKEVAKHGIEEGEELFHNNHNLSKLRITKCSVLRELPDGLDTLESLEELVIIDCPKLKSIGNPSAGAGQCQGILSWVCIIGCEELVGFPRKMLESWAPTIATLDLERLRSLENLPMLIDCLAKSSRLKRLRIVGIPNFKAIGSVKRWGLGSLEKLNIDVSVEWSRENSGAIQYAVDGIMQGCCNSLYELILKGVEIGCNKLRRLSSEDALRHLTRLNQLGIAKGPSSLSLLIFEEEYYLFRGFDGDAQQLQRTLVMILAYLSDALKKFITQNAVNIWLRELEALAFNADNVLD
ncbi:disease resistance protein RGA2-like [Salvia hispanica]|uniref:disease resistance protein RGA2-like n=1 Tax=Salvia hispanica TaxID=49212 RepID=UPI0020098564|nr:disease resistance protein RGA2-like [Salvia hispanica]